MSGGHVARPHSYNCKSVISGTKPVGNGLSSDTRILDIFVGGCGLDTTEDDIFKYCNDNGVNLKKCELLQSKSEWYKSFKVSVIADNRDELLKSEFWPKGIFVRKFFRPKYREI